MAVLLTRERLSPRITKVARAVYVMAKCEVSYCTGDECCGVCVCVSVC